jgi:hypothetical protein
MRIRPFFELMTIIFIIFEKQFSSPMELFFGPDGIFPYYSFFRYSGTSERVMNNLN